MTSPETLARQVEDLSRVLHAIYQKEARRQAGTGEDAVRHPDNYDALPEHTKEYDRVLARFILQREQQVRRETWEKALNWMERRTYYDPETIKEFRRRAQGGKDA